MNLFRAHSPDTAATASPLPVAPPDRWKRRGQKLDICPTSVAHERRRTWTAQVTEDAFPAALVRRRCYGVVVYLRPTGCAQPASGIRLTCV
jgi:hypothetical protein